MVPSVSRDPTLSSPRCSRPTRRSSARAQISAIFIVRGYRKNHEPIKLERKKHPHFKCIKFWGGVFFSFSSFCLIFQFTGSLWIWFLVLQMGTSWLLGDLGSHFPPNSPNAGNAQVARGEEVGCKSRTHLGQHHKGPPGAGVPKHSTAVWVD